MIQNRLSFFPGGRSCGEDEPPGPKL